MAIVSVNILKQGGGDDDSRNTTFTDEYEVITDDCDDRITTLSSILTADDGEEAIPQIGAQHPDDEDAICVGRTAEQNDFVWTVRCTYTTEKTDTPLNATPELRWDAREYKRPVVHDKAGNAIVNTAGIPPDPYPEIDDADMTLVIVRNEASFDPVEKMTYRYTLSDRTFFGFEGVQCRLRPITAQRVLEPFQYYKVTYTVDIVSRKDEDGAEKGWTLRFLSAGLVELVGGVRTPISMGGQPASQPVPLDANGAKLAVGSTAYVYKEFEIYPEKDWTSLNLEGA